MKRKTILNTMMAIGIALMLNGCAGKDGAPGATGPAGANGVANITSNVYPITPGSWSNPGTGEYAVNISDASITDATNDGVEVFISTNGTLWLGLPATNLLVNGDQMEFAYQTGQVSLIYLNSSAPSNTVSLKVVTIPPAIMKQHPNTNWKDYSQVQSIINSQNANQ
ncbi:MAG TPA: hypothetical protein VK806_02570 [Bacteroidia bacterium]|jgi:hypothetical protein|nr:hypothetical protein [Bacteroidia bacterium]